MKFCKNCGTALDDSAAFCRNCGTPAAPAPAKAEPVTNNYYNPVQAAPEQTPVFTQSEADPVTRQAAFEEAPQKADQETPAEEPAAAPEPSSEEKLLTEIRDILAKKK